MRYYLILFMCAAGLISCKGNSENVSDKTISNSDVYTRKIDSLFSLTIISDTNSNYIISVFDSSKNYLSAINGCGNCFINYSENPIVAKKLSIYNNPALVIDAGINGSTYGAKILFIVWQESSWRTWNIYRAPFDKFDIKDVDNDGVEEIIEYLPNNDSVSYNFDRGMLFSKR